MNNGEDGVFDTLYGRHRDWVHRMAFRLTGSPQMADDVLQDTFCYFLGKFPGFDLRCELRQLPSELGSPSAEADLAIRRMDVARMSHIRRRTRLKRASTAVAAMAACLALAIYFLQQSGTAPGKAAVVQQDSAAIILREVSALFPGQIQAIQRDASGLHLSIADVPGVDSTLPVVLEIRSNGDFHEIITFSGQTIEIMGRSVTLEADPVRGVVLKGEDFDWSSTRHASPKKQDFTINARTI